MRVYFATTNSYVSITDPVHWRTVLWLQFEVRIRPEIVRLARYSFNSQGFCVLGAYCPRCNLLLDGKGILPTVGDLVSNAIVPKNWLPLSFSTGRFFLVRAGLIILRLDQLFSTCQQGVRTGFGMNHEKKKSSFIFDLLFSRSFYCCKRHKHDAAGLLNRRCRWCCCWKCLIVAELFSPAGRRRWRYDRSIYR